MLQYRLGASRCFYHTFLQKSNAVAALHLVNIRSGCYDGDATPTQPAEHIPELLSAHGINTRSGFVEQQDAWLMNQGAAEGKLLLHTSRQRSCFTFTERFDLLVYGFDIVVFCFYGGGEECGKEFQILFHRKVLIERKASGHISHAFPYIFHAGNHIIAIHRHSSCLRQQQRGKDAEKRGLASTVGTDKSEHLAFIHRETDIVQSLHLAIML